MNMKMTNIVRSVVALVLLCMGADAMALDLPVKRVKGRQYYYYKVNKGESLYGVSKTLGIPISDILKENAYAADGIRKGDLLIFPYEEYKDSGPETVVEILDVDTIAVDTVVPEAVERRVPSIALLLPFGLNAEQPTRRNSLALDFYRGFLVAADSLAGRDGKVGIVVRDIDGLDAAGIASLMDSDSAVAKATVIVPPDEETALRKVADMSARNGSYVFNVFNIRDSLYRDNAFMLQANVPQRQMYEKAVDGLEESFPDFRPVILRSISGAKDKELFTAYLIERFKAKGIEPIMVEYESNLMMSDLEVLPVGTGERYVIIPSSGTLAEFNRFAYVLCAWRDKLKAASENPEEAFSAYVEVFGYPDWTAFRGDALETLHRLDATVYSRFFDDFNGFSAKNISADFKHWYGTEPIESVPTYGLLGFDTATFLIKNLRAGDGKFEPVTRPFSGIQSTFDFRKDGEGYVNDGLYIIRYQPEGRQSARVQ